MSSHGLLSHHRFAPATASSVKHISFSRSKGFWVRCCFDHQRRVKTFLSAEGKTREERKLYQFHDRNPFPAFYGFLTASCNQIFSGLNEVAVPGNDGKESRLSHMTVFGLFGFVFFILRVRGSLKELLYHIQAPILDTSRGMTRPVSLLQFGAITSALQYIPFDFRSLGLTVETLPRISYVMDVFLERHPIAYILLLMIVIFTLISIGGLLFSKFRSYEQKVGDSFWDAWACVCSASTHLKEKTARERFIGFLLAVGGLFFYSLLISTMTAQFKSRMEWLREGAHSEVMEQGHIVICGVNDHLSTVLKQLNKSQEIAQHAGLSWPRKQTVVLLSEHDRKITEKIVAYGSKHLSRLNIHTRSGSLSNTISFERVAADRARSIIVLAPPGNKYEADAGSVLTVLALQPLLENKPNKLVVEVVDSNTLDLLKSSKNLKVNPLQNLSAKVLVQCSRQPGLIDVYRKLLEHDGQVINLRTYPNLVGFRYDEVRKGFSRAVVCGLIRDGKVDFHPHDSLELNETDKLLLICAKNEYKQAPDAIRAHPTFKAEPSQTSTPKKSATSMNYATKKISKAADWQAGPKERILILGWHPRVTEMILEYDDYVGPGSELIILADTQVDERERIINKYVNKQLQNIHVIHQVGDPMNRGDLKTAILSPSKSTKGGAKRRKNLNIKMPLSILVIADDKWSKAVKSRPDKKSVLALLLAEETCKRLDIEVTGLIAEFIDVELGKQVMNLHPHLTAIGTDEIIGLVTSQVAEEPELNDIWTELLNSWGNEIYMKDIKQYVEPLESISFAELSERAALNDEVAIGVRMGGKTVINPTSKDEPLSFSSGDALVLIAEFEFNGMNNHQERQFGRVV